MERHWCLDCKTLGTLSRNGNCGTCGSQAVVSEHHQWVGFVDWCEDAIVRAEIGRAERLLDNKFDESFLRSMNISIQ